jgi:hypothetical protein
MGFGRIWEMKNVHCLMLAGLNSLAVYRGDDVIGGVSEVNGEPSLSLYGTQTLTFNDLDIIVDNWNQMMEMKASERGDEIVKILKEELAKQYPV